MQFKHSITDPAGGATAVLLIILEGGQLGVIVEGGGGRLGAVNIRVEGGRVLARVADREQIADPRAAAEEIVLADLNSPAGETGVGRSGAAGASGAD